MLTKEQPSDLCDTVLMLIVKHVLINEYIWVLARYWAIVKQMYLPLEIHDYSTFMFVISIFSLDVHKLQLISFYIKIF